MGALASLWPCDIDVELGSYVYTIPAAPASVWIEAIGNPDGGAIVPGLLNETDQRLVWREYIGGLLQPEEISAAWRDVLTAAIGRPWWEGAKLVLDALRPDVWPVVHGRLVRSGIDLDRISIAAFWNAVYTMALEGCKDDDERTKFKFDLALPPPEFTADAYDAESVGNDFMAAMATLQQLQG